jgi:hypothetical protein
MDEWGIAKPLAIGGIGQARTEKPAKHIEKREAYLGKQEGEVERREEGPPKEGALPEQLGR